MFPILDARGNVIGFGGRVIGEGEPKYLNSPETPLFEKGRELYGLYQARRAIRDANQVIVVEGYMDVVALAQHGVENAVATLGTATTPVHVAKLLQARRQRRVLLRRRQRPGARRRGGRSRCRLPVLADGKVGELPLPARRGRSGHLRAPPGQGGVPRRAVAAAKPLSQFLFAELASNVDMATEEGRARVPRPGEAARGPDRGAGAGRHDAPAPGRDGAARSGGDRPASSRAGPRGAAPRPPARARAHATPSLEAACCAPAAAARLALVARCPTMVLDRRRTEPPRCGAVLRLLPRSERRSDPRASERLLRRIGAPCRASRMRWREPLLKQAESPDFDLAAEVDGLWSRSCARGAPRAPRPSSSTARWRRATPPPSRRPSSARCHARLANAEVGESDHGSGGQNFDKIIGFPEHLRAGSATPVKKSSKDSSTRHELKLAEVEAQKKRLKNLIVLGKERGYLTYAEINDHLPDDMTDAEQIEGVVTMLADMGIAVYDEAPGRRDAPA